MSEHDATPAAGGAKQPWPLWEVFVRPARGLSHTHAGSLHAADAQMAVANARDLYALQLQDPRIGFEASNHYYYLPQDLQEKFLNCQHLLREVARASRP